MSAVLHKIGDGVRVVIDPMPNVRSVSCGVFVLAGARDETEEEHGGAHLVEHLAFKGAGSRTGFELSRDMETVGGWTNADTSHERTAYYARALSDDFTLAMEIIRDLALFPHADETALEQEKKVILQEIAEAADTPDDVMLELLQQASFGGHSLGGSILGSAASVESFSLDAVQAFRHETNNPGTVIVSIAGGVSVDRALSMANELYGAWSRERKPQRRPRFAPRFTSGFEHQRADCDQSHLGIAFPAVPAGDDAAPAFRVLGEILGGGMSSRLFQDIREKHGLAYTIDAAYEPYSDAGLITVTTGTADRYTQKTAGLIVENLASLATSVTEEELGRAVKTLLAGSIMAMENPSSRMDQAAGQVIMHGAPIPFDLVAEKYNSLTIEDVTKAAQMALSCPPAAALVGGASPISVREALCQVS